MNNPEVMSETNEKLNRICIEHGVHVIADMHKEIVEFWDAIPNDAKLAIRGAGKHTVELFNMVRYWEKNIVGIFDDSKAYQEELPYSVLDVSDMEKFDFDVIYFASYYHRFEMMDQLKEKFPEQRYQYLDLYSYLMKEKNRAAVREFFEEVYFNEMFYVEIDNETRMALELYYARRYFEEERKLDDLSASRYLRLLISDYIRVKDFAHAYFCIEEYIANQYEDYDRYQNFRKHMDKFLEELKMNILSRKASDSTMFFMIFDGMSYEIINSSDRYNMKFLREYTEQRGVEFKNAYSPGGFTREVMRSIFFKENMLSEGFYDLDVSDKTTNLFYRYLADKGFRIKTYGTLDLELRDKQWLVSISKLFWNVVCDLSENDEPTFYYIHELGLFHYPTQCNKQSHIPIDWVMQQDVNLNPQLVRHDVVKNSAEYLDHNMRFYFEYFSENSSKVIFADHGWLHGENETIYNDLKPWKESGAHVPLLVISKHFQPQKVSDIYSTFYLSDLLYDLLNKTNTFFERKIEFAQTNSNVIYNKEAFYLSKKQFCRCLVVAFRAFTTLEDKYVITYAGQEYYYRLPDETTNLINDPKYQERIKYIKSKNDLSFPDFRHPKYKETRHLYFDERDQPIQFFEE